MALLACAACDAPPVERGGGALASFTREVEARVTYGFPGIWRWETAYRAPGHYRFSLVTQGDPHHYVFDGKSLRAYVGTALVTESASDAAALRSIGRWLAMSSVAASEIGRAGIGESGTRFELAREEVPEGAARGIEWRFGEGGSRYVIGLDAAGRIISAAGPVEIPGIGAGRMSARFESFRPVGGRELPFVARYQLDDEPFFEERVLRWVPGAAVIEPAQLERDDPGARSSVSSPGSGSGAHAPGHDGPQARRVWAARWHGTCFRDDPGGKT